MYVNCSSCHQYEHTRARARGARAGAARGRARAARRAARMEPAAFVFLLVCLARVAISMGRPPLRNNSAEYLDMPFVLFFVIKD